MHRCSRIVTASLAARERCDRGAVVASLGPDVLDLTGRSIPAGLPCIVIYSWYISWYTLSGDGAVDLVALSIFLKRLLYV